MKKTVKAFQVAALLSAASLLAVSSAKAAEERLHSSSSKLYGLVAPGEGSKNSTNSNSVGTANDVASSVSTAKTGKNRSGGNLGNEPQIEDPPMPSYDGPNGDGNAVASNDGAGSPSLK